MSAVLKTVHYTLGDTLDLEHERRSIAVRALIAAGATPGELGDMHSGLTVIDGKITRILAVYVADPTPAAKDANRVVKTQEDMDEMRARAAADGRCPRCLCAFDSDAHRHCT